MGPKQIEVLRHINRISLLHRLRVHNLLSDTGVWGSQIPVLLHVERNPGCTQTDIAEHLGVSSRPSPPPSSGCKRPACWKSGRTRRTCAAITSN